METKLALIKDSMAASASYSNEDLEQYIYEQNGEHRASQIYSADLSEKHIVNIPEILKKFNSLRCLILRMNKIVDVGGEALHGHRTLRELDLSSNLLTTTSGLESLKELRSLLLQFNKIQHVDGLGGLKKLQVLQLHNNNITGQLKQHTLPTSLTVLDLSSNHLTSLQGLGALSNLKELRATDNNLTKISGLSKCKEITDLDVSHNSISECQGLKAMVKLRVLNLNANKMENLDALPVLPQLEELYAAQNRLLSIPQFTSMSSSLEILDIRENLLPNVENLFQVLGTLENLVELSISETAIPHNRYDEWNNLLDALPMLEMFNEKHVGSHTASIVGTQASSDGLVPATPPGHRPPIRPVTASSRARQVLGNHASKQIETMNDQTDVAEKALLSQFQHVASIVTRLTPSTTSAPQAALAQSLATNPSDITGSSLAVQASFAPLRGNSEEHPRPESRSGRGARLAQATAFAKAAQ
eukprot:m.623207 g.623207  ORF g.623207 m.623207 type:complete len:473 (-) comp22544_c3_seq1:312-1730(-)